MKFTKCTVILIIVVCFLLYVMGSVNADQTIIGGQPAIPGQFYAFAHIGNCGARLLYEGDIEKNIPSVFVTDGHCVVSKFDSGPLCIVHLDERVVIRLGDVGPKNEGTEQEVRSLKVEVNPGYIPGCNGNYDSALIFAPPIGANHYVHASQLLLPSESHLLKEGAEMVLAGKGLIQLDPQVKPDRLQWISFQVKKCSSDKYPNMFCTGSDPNGPVKDSCFGDSGSALQIKVNGVDKAAGAVVYVTCKGSSMNLSYAAPEIHYWIVSRAEQYTGVNILTPTPVPPFDATATPTLTPTPTKGPDTDTDEVMDTVEDTNKNSDLEDDDNDADGIPNYRDPDDDNDKVWREGYYFYGAQFCTGAEDYPDTNCDGVLNIYSEDDDGDGLKSVCETDVDGFNLQNPDESPRDYISDHVDPDDDNDGVPTQYELGPEYTGDCKQFADRNGDGIPAYKDPTEVEYLALPGPTPIPTPTPTRVEGLTANWHTQTLTVTSRAGFTNSLVISNANAVSVVVDLSLYSPFSVTAPAGWETVEESSEGVTIQSAATIEANGTYAFQWPSTPFGFRKKEISVCWNQRQDCAVFTVSEDAQELYLPLIRR